MYFLIKDVSRQAGQKVESMKTVDTVQDVEEESYFFKVNFLKKKTVYVIEYFNTLTNERYAIQEVKTSNKGALKIYVPKMDCSITTDLAYKIVIKGNSFK